jgi:hypothetical protein
MRVGRESKMHSAKLTPKAIVWVVEDLDVTIRDLGSVEYYGTPTVKKSISDLANVTSLGNR